MITQKFKNGSSEIRIESAISLDEAKIHGFPEGVYSRYFIDDKPVDSYFGIVDHILKSAKTGNTFKTPSDVELKTMQRNLVDNQKQEMKKQIDKLKATYKEMDIPDSVLDQFDYMVDSMDIRGVRVAK